MQESLTRGAYALPFKGLGMVIYMQHKQERTIQDPEEEELHRSNHVGLIRRLFCFT